MELEARRSGGHGLWLLIAAIGLIATLVILGRSSESDS